MATKPNTRGRKASPPKRFSRGRPYRRARQAWFNSDPLLRLCAHCLAQGRTTAATQLDHIRRAADRPDLFFDESNWQPLCDACHTAKTQQENA